jgi:hypothetical protein
MLFELVADLVNRQRADLILHEPAHSFDTIGKSFVDRMKKDLANREPREHPEDGQGESQRSRVPGREPESDGPGFTRTFPP